MGGACPEFEPYLDDLLENQDFSRCQELVNQKRFDWEQEACPDFDPVIEKKKGGLDTNVKILAYIDGWCRNLIV